MKSDKIYIQEWLEFHPYEKPSKSDYFYLKVCNKIDEFIVIASDLLFDDEMLLEESSDIHAANIFVEEVKQREMLDMQHGFFLEFNGGKPIQFFVKMTEVNEFFNAFNRFHNEKVSGKKEETAPLFTNKIDNELTEGEHKDESNIIVFFNKNSGLEIAFLGEYISDKNNPCFNPEHDRRDAVNMIFDDSLSKELVEYVIANYDLELPLFPDDENNRLLKENLDFLLRFYKKESYHTKPQISLV